MCEKNFIKRAIFACILFLYTSSVLSQDGSSVFNFLRFPNSARVGALGGTNVSAVENDLSMIYQNPALLGQEMDMNLNLGYMSYIGDIGSGNVTFTKAMGTKSSWGVGVNYFNYGDIEQAGTDNIITGSSSAKDICVNAFLSRDLTDKLRGGVTSKFIYSNFDEYTSIGVAFDLGLSYYDRDHDFSFGITGKNLGRQLVSYDEKREKLPWDIQMGITKKLSHAPIRFSVTTMYLNEWDFYNINGEKDNFGTTLIKHFVFGAEFIPNDNFWIGLGYNPKIGSDMSLLDANKLSGFSGGAGIRVKAFNVGCSVGKYHPSATSFMLNLTTSLSELNL